MELNFVLTQAEADAILGVLAGGEFRVVAPLINKLQSQAQPQFTQQFEKTKEDKKK